MVWPPRSSDPASLLSACATVLKWPLVADGDGMSADRVLRLLERAPGTVVATRCRDAGLDAVVLGPRAGRKANRLLERHPVFQPGAAPVPVLRGVASVTLLIRAGTAAALEGLRDVRIVTGTDLLPLPPTRGVVWDTPPWQPLLREPAGLPTGVALRPVLKDALTERV
ncbi:hypothetical protein [Streptomyces sp. NPDC001889]